MAYLFPSREWAEIFMDELNNDDEFAKAGAKWEGDINFVIQDLPGTATNEVIYLDLWHGKCRGVDYTAERDAKDAAFDIIAPLSNWKRVISKQIGPIPAMVSGQLKVKGNLPYILRYVVSAQRMVECAGRLNTIFPDEKSQPSKSQ